MAQLRISVKLKEEVLPSYYGKNSRLKQPGKYKCLTMVKIACDMMAMSSFVHNACGKVKICRVCLQSDVCPSQFNFE